MASPVFLRALMLFALLMLTVSKNVAPSSSKHPALDGTSAQSSRNRAPVVNVKGSVHGPNHKSTQPPVPESHVFYNNYKLNFSWEDPLLQAALGVTARETTTTGSHFNKRGSNHLSKRTPGSSKNDPVFKVPSCLGCIEASMGLKVTLADLSVRFLETQITKTDAQLKNKCLFYTSVPRQGQELRDRNDLGGAEKHSGLSKIATDYACNNNLYTIWVCENILTHGLGGEWMAKSSQDWKQIFPGLNDITENPDDPKARNFFEVFVKGSWLNFLHNEKEDFYRYFENMSKAMASHCGGTIYVMTMRPNELNKYGFVWGNHEYPLLHSRFVAGLDGKPETLIAINAANGKETPIDWETLLPKPAGTEDDDDFLHFNDSSLVQRDTCGPNLDYERPDQDWFG